MQSRSEEVRDVVALRHNRSDKQEQDNEQRNEMSATDDEGTDEGLHCHKCNQTHGSTDINVGTCFANKCSRIVCDDCCSKFCDAKNIPMLRKDNTGTETGTVRSIRKKKANLKRRRSGREAKKAH